MNVLLLFEALLKNIICFLFQTDQPGGKNTAPRGIAFMSNLINCCFSEVFAHTHDPCLKWSSVTQYLLGDRQCLVVRPGFR